MPNKMKMTTLWLPQSWMDRLDALVKEKGYPNRSEVICIAILDLLKEEEKVK